MVKAPEWHHHVDAALLCASVSTSEVVPWPWPDLDIDPGIEPWCTWIERVWAHSGVAEAIAVASPVLASRVEALHAGVRPDAAQVRQDDRIPPVTPPRPLCAVPQRPDQRHRGARLRLHAAP